MQHTSSKTTSDNRFPSPEKQGDVRDRTLKDDRERKQTTKINDKDQMVLQYSIDEEKYHLQNRRWSNLVTGEQRRTSDAAQIGRRRKNPSIDMIGRVKIPATKTRIGNRKLSKEPYVKVRIFDDSDKITLFRKGNDKVSVSFGFTGLRVRCISCIFDTCTGPNLLQGTLVDPDWLLLIRPYDS